MTNKKTVKLLIGILVLGIFLISFTSAEFWACFEHGDRIDYCSNYRPSETYNGNYPLCMSEYRASENCYVHGVWDHCSSLPPGQCTTSGTAPEIDSTPPILNILKPINNSLYTKKSVVLEFSLNEMADVYYTDMINGRGKWIKVCDNCNIGNPSYSKNRTFVEGENDLIFKAIDVVGNEAYSSVNFFVDSVKPRIYKTYPSRGFVNTEFEVQFKEANPKELILYYGEDEAEVDLNNCEEYRGKTTCTIDVNLDKYNGQNIKYHFEIEDIAGNTYSSREYEISIDTEDPKVTNEEDFFTLGEGRYSRYVFFNIGIDEDNFYKATYSYLYNGRIYERALCTRLYGGFCEKKISFREGNYSLTIQIYDKAGHSIGIPANFDINY